MNSFHTGIELMLYPWGYTEEQPADDEMFARICGGIGEPDPDFCGPVFDTIYPASGITIDAAYERHGSVAWTYEVADEQFGPASVEDTRERPDRYWDGVEHAFLNVERYGAHLEVVQADVTTADAGAQVDVAVANDGYGSALWVGVTVAAGDGAQDTLRFQDVPANGTVEGQATLDAGADALATGLDVTSGTPSGTSPNPSPRRTTRASGACPPSGCWARSRPRRPPSASRAVPEGT